MPVSIRSMPNRRLFALENLTDTSFETLRIPSGMTEIDRITDGNFVRGSV
jgi:hypothetical protein